MARQRRTRQQEAIENVFHRVERPLSPQEIHKEARDTLPGLGMATVYRTLNHMVEDGDLHVVELPGQSSRYENAGLHHHHHFHCTGCDRVYDLDGCLLREKLNLPPGFTVTAHDITLTGTCPDCEA